MLTKCIWCEDEPIKIKRTFLGKKCYALIRAHGKPEKKNRTTKTIGYVPVPNDMTYRRGKTIKTLIYKYGAKILGDFLLLSWKPFYTMTCFSEKYGFTREYARQIHLKLLGRPYQEIASNKTRAISEERKSMGCIHDPRQKINYYKKDTNKYKGVKIEKLFFDLCEERGLNPKAPCSPEIDLKINGYLVDVKSCFTPWVGIGAKTPYLRFNISKNQRKKCDFFACYHGVVEKFFIIPTSALGKSNIIYLSEIKTNYYGSKNRYWEYKDAWHLLE